MEYNWLTSHDPITIDANLAEIDFDDFKNEDIQNAYAFSLQSYVSISMSKHFYRIKSLFMIHLMVRKRTVCPYINPIYGIYPFPSPRLYLL